MSQGSITIETIASDVLRGNPLSDPFVRRVPIYLPPDYDTSSARYPVAFVLAGFTGRGLE
jgi:enterochelin esterase family protein